ncbi:MAG: tetraacyldisaccharide 4'-kinase [Hyphomonadaceae bacterium]
MRPPEFWKHERGKESAPALRALLTPASWAYAWAGAERLRKAAPHRVTRPVICVGNLTLGGSGKTPVVRALRAITADMGVAAHTLSRGHGGKLAGPLRVDPARHTAAEVGDEPLLHAGDGPAWIARDRAAGAEAAIAAGAAAIVMDDGFQNPMLAKDLSILVFDAPAGLGNGRVFPAGPLREPLAAGLARADLVILMGSAETPAWFAGFTGPIVHGVLTALERAPPGPLLAFAGIGRPEKFFASLADAGGDVMDGEAFPDHHRYTPGELHALERSALRRSARLITTEKDHVRLPRAWAGRVATFPVHAAFENEAPLRAALERVLNRPGEAR